MMMPILFPHRDPCHFFHRHLATPEGRDILSFAKSEYGSQRLHSGFHSELPSPRELALGGVMGVLCPV